MAGGVAYRENPDGPGRERPTAPLQRARPDGPQNQIEGGAGSQAYREEDFLLRDLRPEHVQVSVGVRIERGATHQAPFPDPGVPDHDDLGLGPRTLHGPLIPGGWLKRPPLVRASDFLSSVAGPTRRPTLSGFLCPGRGRAS